MGTLHVQLRDADVKPPRIAGRNAVDVDVTEKNNLRVKFTDGELVVAAGSWAWYTT